MEKNIIQKLKEIPKVDLHIHLDGSIPISYVKEKYNLSDEDIKSKMVASKKCKNLNDYLTCFDFPISIMQTKEELQEITIELLRKLKEQNLVYVELRFAPQLHTKKGLSQEDVVKYVLEAKEKVGIKSNIILCLMRGNNNEKENYETINIAKKYLKKGVCAIDLAGAEALFKTEEYKEAFKYAKKIGVPFTIHAGEADGANSIKSAISYGAKRLGHGVRAIEDELLVNTLINEKITLEVCPSSNIQTCICESFSTHPIEKLYRKGVLITINTDNMTVSNTTLFNEYVNLIENTGLLYEDIVQMIKNSVKVAFLSDDEKNELLSKYWEE